MPDKELRFTGAPGKVVLAVVGKAVETRWDEALRTAGRTPGRTVDEKVAAISSTFVKQLAALGAAAGGTAAVPGVGTLAALGATTAELGAFTFRSAEMILTIAAAHGHTEAEVEQRRAWVLSVLAFGDDAAIGFEEVSTKLAAGMTLQAARSGGNSWFQTVNRYLGRKILARWGARRGATVLGKVLPFGIGAAFGAGTNFAMARAIARHADKFFRSLPASLEALPAAVR